MLLWKNGYKALQINKILFSSFVLLVIAGCKEDFPTYVSPLTTPSKTLQCLHYMALNHLDKQQIQNAFGIEDNATCPYTVTLTRYYVGQCDNLVVKSVGGDFNGYVRIEVKKGFKCYYKVQSDFKHDDTAAFSRVLEKIKETIK